MFCKKTVPRSGIKLDQYTKIGQYIGLISNHITQFQCPNAGTVVLQDIHAENKFFIFIALSCYLTTPANLPIISIKQS